ncbi:Fasciclin domain-containing protein [Pleurostoma richardsiae]|uniref:Fasciclin domain-containing protein n=1 Tax=Pleurostoma richardsiae TaxID=41990 RepID=A0AA38VU72_9PEZI|nr:Fasciclin domain-containing protein [Pleurostoma richardsiae]
MFGTSARAAFRLPTVLLALLSAAVSAPLAAAASLDSVLSEQANLTTFRSLVKDRSDIFGNLPDQVTIIAPSDGAFAKLQGWNAKNTSVVTPLLQYHILSGEVALSLIPLGKWVFAHTLLDDPSQANVTGGQNVIITHQPGNVVVFTSGLASRATVLQGDIAFDGGLIQVIDSVMVVPASLEVTARDAYTDLASFLGALYAADLVDEFTAASNITLIIPRNAAFQQLAGTFAAMSKDQLSRVLRYHMLPGQVVQSEQMTANSTFSTSISGERIHVRRFNNDIFVNSAKIIQTDILVANGVVQMIDNVLSPDDDNVQPNFTASDQAPVFTPVGSTQTGSAAATPFISELPCTVSCTVSTSGGGAAAKTTSVRSSSSTDGAAAARCTAIAGAGLGLGVAVGVMGMEWMGAM